MIITRRIKEGEKREGEKQEVEETEGGEVRAQREEDRELKTGVNVRYMRKDENHRK